MCHGLPILWCHARERGKSSTPGIATVTEANSLRTPDQRRVTDGGWGWRGEGVTSLVGQPLGAAQSMKVLLDHMTAVSSPTPPTRCAFRRMENRTIRSSAGYRSTASTCVETAAGIGTRHWVQSFWICGQLSNRASHRVLWVTRKAARD